MTGITYTLFCPNCGKQIHDIIENSTVTCTCGCTTKLTNDGDGYITLKVK